MTNAKLTVAQQREYEILKAHGSCYVYGWRRRGIFEILVKKGLAETDGSWWWFHLKRTNG